MGSLPALVQVCCAIGIKRANGLKTKSGYVDLPAAVYVFCRRA